MYPSHRRPLPFTRVLALLCLFGLLVASFAAPIHKHDPGQEANCCLCHVADQAPVVAIRSDAGRPYAPLQFWIIAATTAFALGDVAKTLQIPRAPPQLLSSF
ncbi:MAG: hypothetical protein JOY54_19625 [Acidobacteriaceae bacterium]|nr:hypothetical protein [Acidobacteriaceae bacterium]